MVNPTVLCGPPVWSQYVNTHSRTSWVLFGLRKALQFQYCFSVLYLNISASSGSRIFLLDKSGMFLSRASTFITSDPGVSAMMWPTCGWFNGANLEELMQMLQWVVIPTELDWTLMCLSSPVIQMFMFQRSGAALLVPVVIIIFHYSFYFKQCLCPFLL